MVAGAMTAGCTDVNDELGQGLIPHDQQMVLKIDTLGSFETFTATNDTIPVSHQGRLFIGNRIDPVFGKVKAAGMTDFYPYVSWNGGHFYGYNAVADSIYLDMQINSITGDPSIEQTFNIYAMTDSLKRDSIYMRGNPIEWPVDRAKPLFSFKLSNEIPEESVAMLELEPTAEGRAFMQRLADIDSATYAAPWPKFRKEFHGLYVAPAPGGPENAAVYEIELVNSAIYMYFHNYEKNTSTATVDTVTWSQYNFNNSGWYDSNKKLITSVVNQNVMDVRFEYPAAIKGRLNDTLHTSLPLETVYVQGLGGVATYLRVSDETVDYLAHITEQDGMTYSAAVISQARLYFPLADRSAAAMDIAPKRLGMYYTYGQPLLEAYNYYYTPIYGPVPMFGYDYATENYNALQSSSASLTTPTPYGGYLNRTNGYYEMVVTKYITQLMLYPDKAPREIWLGPEVNSRLSDYSQVALRGSGGTGDNPVRLVVTYTLIK